jgi:hypothetical protein
MENYRKGKIKIGISKNQKREIKTQKLKIKTRKSKITAREKSKKRNQNPKIKH